MALVFDPVEGQAQAWGINETISPVEIPTPTGAVGAVSYVWSGLPQGVEFNEDTLVLYGAPTETGTGRFVLEAEDDDGTVEWPFDWSVAEFEPQLEVGAFEDLRVTIGQPVDYALPAPTGGTPPYSYEIVDPVYSFTELGRGWPYDPRLPQGIQFQDGMFTGTATDTQDNRGEIWYNQVSRVNRFTQGNPVNRLFPNWQIPTRIENRFFDYETSRYDITVLLSRTRPTPGVAYGPDAPGGGLRFRVTTPSGHGFLHERNVGTVPHCNPFLRITSVQEPSRVAYFYFSEDTRGPSATWQLFLASTRGAVAPWLDSEANTGNQFRVEIGTARTYPITIRVRDSVGSAVEQTIHVRVDSAPPGAPAAPGIVSAQVTAHAADITIALPGVGETAEYAFEAGGRQPVKWTPFEGDRLLLTGLTPATSYNLWIRFRNQAGAGAALFLDVQTLAAAGIVQAPAPTSFTLDNNPGDQQGILDGKLRARWDVADITTQVLGYDYKINLASEPEAGGQWRAMPASTSSTSVFTWHGLKNGQEYRLQIRARNDAGPGRVATITGTPQQGRADTGYARWQFQVMMDLTGAEDDPRDVPWFDLASRCLEAYVQGGRAARQQLTATGTCAFLLETSDDFINVEGTSLYRLDDLQNRIVHLNEVLETPSGLRRRTRFAGLVETARFTTSGNRSVIEVTAVDFFGLMAQDTATFNVDLPAQSTGERVRLLLDTAGWEARGTQLRSYDPDLIDEGSKTCAQIRVESGSQFEVNLLDELNLIAQSEGGRLYMAGGGDNQPGQVRFDGASPVTNYDGRISDQRTADPVIVQMGGQPVVESEDSFLYNDFELSYPGGEQPERRQNSLSQAVWGKRSYDLYNEVRTDQQSTAALLRALVKQYGTPRRWISELPIAAHFQTDMAAQVLQDLDLSKSLLLDYRPPGARDTISGLQRVDSIRISYQPLDRQFVSVNVSLGLLIPEASAYWILDVEGADRFDARPEQTSLAPRRNLDPLEHIPGGRLPGGFRVTEDREFQIVSSNRWDALVSQQTLPRYASEADRDSHETEPVDGHSCVVIETSPAGVRAYWLYEYDGEAFQWLRRGQLTQADANPTTNTLILGDVTRGVLGLAAGNVLASGTIASDLRK